MTDRDITSTGGGGGVTEESKVGVDDLVGVVEVQARADLREDGLVRVLLGNLTAHGGRERESREEGDKRKRGLDEDHGESDVR